MRYFFVFLLLFLSGCSEPAVPPTKKDSVPIVKTTPPAHDSPIAKKADTLPAAPTSANTATHDTTQKKTTPKNTGSTYSYYTNKKTSVEITPWVNFERNVILYNTSGVQTYTMREVRRSYSTTVTLRYRADGSVASANIHDAPDGSRYWYETTITFSSDNEPLTKTSQRMPTESLEELNGNTWNWDKTKGDWTKQSGKDGNF